MRRLFDYIAVFCNRQRLHNAYAPFVAEQAIERSRRFRPPTSIGHPAFGSPFSRYGPQAFAG